MDSLAGIAPPSTQIARLRALRRPADDGPMNEVANASREADGDRYATTLGQFVAMYDHLVNCDPARDVVVAEAATVAGAGARTETEAAAEAERARAAVADEPEEAGVVGYGRIWLSHELMGDDVYWTVGHVHPAWHRRGVGRAILQWQERRAREIAEATPGNEHGSYLQAEANAAAPGRGALLEASGFVPIRWSFGMVRPTLEDVPDALLPEGLEIREVRPEHMRAIWEAEAEAFRDHWGAREPAEEDFQVFLADPVQGDTSLWRVAWDGDQVAGMVRSYISTEENERYGRRRGYVESISVRRPWRRRGLARALIAASIPLLRARGMTEGALGVDAENLSGALRLYEGVGFVEESRVAIWRKPL